MSWDGYIDNVVANAEGHCDKAAIIGKNGSMWTSAGHAKALKLTQQEASSIGAAFQSGKLDQFLASGIHVENVKYQVLRVDGTTVYAKRKDHGALTLQETNTGVVIGHTSEGKQQGNVNVAVDKVAAYLKGSNY